MNEEIMNVEEMEYDEIEINSGGSDLGKGVLVGAGIVGAGFALYKLGKKLASKFKKKDAGIEVPAEQTKLEAADEQK